MRKYKYFSERDFASCTPKCKLEDMNEDFMILLDKIREDAKMPFVLTSAYRLREWELIKKRSGNSAHTRGLAVDIKVADGSQRFKIVQSALKFGIKRIGVAKNYVHLDNDTSLPQSVVWTY